MAAKKVWLIWSGSERDQAEEITAFFLRSGFIPDESEEPAGPAEPEAEEPEDPEDLEEKIAAAAAGREKEAAPAPGILENLIAAAADNTGENAEQAEMQAVPEEAANPAEAVKTAAPEKQETPAATDETEENPAPERPEDSAVPPGPALRRFLAPDRVAEDSAVVLLSDEATADKAWQAAVRAVPESFRIIPVGGTVQIDYSDEKILPRRVQEINYIRPDGHFLASLEDSLLTDPHFYGIRNEVFLMVRMWETSGCDDSRLMSGIRKTKRYLKEFRSVYAREQDPAVRAQGDKACLFLERSYSHALLESLKDAWRYAKNLLLILAGAALLTGFLYIRNVMNRAYYSQILLGIDSSAEDAAVTAVKVAEGITNPYVPESTKVRYYNYLSELLEKNWPNSPLGMGQYKYALNDVVPDADSRYLYTANGKGQAVRWDSWTGEIDRRETVSSSPLAAMALSDSGLRAAIDGTGRIFLSSGKGSWTDTGTVCPIVWTDLVRLRISGDGEQLLALDGNRLWAWSVRDSRLAPLWEKQAETGDAEFTPEGDVLCVIRREEGWQAVRISAGGQETAWALGPDLSEVCNVDVTESRALFADADGRLWIWDSAAPEEMTNTQLLLSQPIAVALSDGDYLVYHDRNEGTRVYDFRIHAVLADCLLYARAARRLELKGSLVMGFSGGMIYSEDLSAVLPKKAVPGDIIRTLDAQSDMNAGNTVKSISIENGYLVKMVLKLQDDTEVLFDPACRYFIGEAQALEEGLPDTYSYYAGITAHMTGRPTVVGIIPEEDTVVMGGYDGSFYEICVNEDGGAVDASHTWVPSHASIRAVHQTADGYYLEDVAGNFWYKRLGYPAMRRSGRYWLQEIREKLRLGAGSDLLDVISPQTAQALGLHRFSVPEGKEWE